jgi:hypothetical protein
MQQINYPQVAAGPEAYKTFAFVAPLATHFRTATCAEVNCAGYERGFKTIVPADGPQATYIRAQSGRRFIETRQPDGMVEFVFPPGQQCFQSAGHRLPLHREPTYYVRDGDHRGNPWGTRALQMRPIDWVDAFQDHQSKVADARERG